MWIRAALLSAAFPGSAAFAEEPLSAIEWLSESITEPVVNTPLNEPPVGPGVESETITTTSLDGPRPDAVGLLPPSVTGLPAALWGPGDPAEIAALIRAEPTETLPAGQALLRMLLLAEAAPPDASGQEGELLLARIDKLLDLGLVEEAGALIERAGIPTPELFRRAFDVALLVGEETEACEAMRARPDVAPTFPARIFCLARGGDWNAAALTLGTTRALGQITEAEEALLSRFLDPDLYEGEPPLPPPERPTPLVFRLYEAVGEDFTSAGLPRAFAHADLRANIGWKPQIEAAERLARTGALDPNRLLGLYTERLPAASGGVWERVGAVQALDVAVEAGDPGAVARALPKAWSEMRAAGLAPALAVLYGEKIARLPLPAEARELAFRLRLLTPAYEAVAAEHEAATPEEALLVAIARGLPPPRTGGTVGTAIQGLAPGALPSAEVAALIQEGQIGEAILLTLEDLAAGNGGDPRRFASALAAFRRLGLESTARRAALEFLILSDPA
jgi:hypothetical protein